ncbi:hypothetical protein EVC45_31645 [Paraburkholderia sp. UYCP14C]|nr:hypothetical protein EVC45_31645 [Paraburkholderia sp. UYCP14C]
MFWTASRLRAKQRSCAVTHPETGCAHAGGLAFGLNSKGHLQFTAVDDNTNTATIWTLREDSH